MNQISDNLHNEVLRLRTENARLQGEKTRLLRKTQTRADVARLENAHRAAGALLESWFSGGAISLSESMDVLKMGRHLWSYARALLIHAGVLDGHRITAETFETARAAIDDSFVAMQQQGTAPIRRYLPIYMRNEAARKRQKRAGLRAGHHAGHNAGRHAGQRAGHASKSCTDSREWRTVGGALNGGVDRKSEVFARHGIQGDD